MCSWLPNFQNIVHQRSNQFYFIQYLNIQFFFNSDLEFLQQRKKTLPSLKFSLRASLLALRRIKGLSTYHNMTHPEVYFDGGLYLPTPIHVHNYSFGSFTLSSTFFIQYSLRVLDSHTID